MKKLVPIYILVHDDVENQTTSFILSRKSYCPNLITVLLKSYTASWEELNANGDEFIFNKLYANEDESDVLFTEYNKDIMTEIYYNIQNKERTFFEYEWGIEYIFDDGIDLSKYDIYELKTEFKIKKV